jgi:AcrR family transcriptional regulator
MRSRLVEAALQVFAAKSVDAAVIDDVIGMAGVSRGTFYNYFRTNEELMAAVLHAVGDELVALIEVAIAERTDPAERLACALRMLMRTAREFPLMARFAARVSMDRGLQNSLGTRYMVRDIQQACALGLFSLRDPHVGVDLAMGATREALFALTRRHDLPDAYPEEITYHVLLGLGLTRSAARRLVAIPIHPMVVPEDSLLSRTQPGHRRARRAAS